MSSRNTADITITGDLGLPVEEAHTTFAGSKLAYLIYVAYTIFLSEVGHSLGEPTMFTVGGSLPSILLNLTKVAHMSASAP